MGCSSRQRVLQESAGSSSCRQRQSGEGIQSRLPNLSVVPRHHDSVLPGRKWPPCYSQAIHDQRSRLSQALTDPKRSLLSQWRREDADLGWRRCQRGCCAKRNDGAHRRLVPSCCWSSCRSFSYGLSACVVLGVAEREPHRRKLLSVVEPYVAGVAEPWNTRALATYQGGYKLSWSPSCLYEPQKLRVNALLRRFPETPTVFTFAKQAAILEHHHSTTGSRTVTTSGRA